MPRYFKKDVPESRLYLPIGKPVPFDAIDRDYGYLVTNDGYIIHELEKMILNKKGGVSEITEQEFNEWVQKKSSQNSQQLQPRQRTTIGPQHRMRGENERSAVPAAASVIGVTAGGLPIASFAMGQKTEGLKVERTFVKPNVGKAK